MKGYNRLEQIMDFLKSHNLVQWTSWWRRLTPRRRRFAAT